MYSSLLNLTLPHFKTYTHMMIPYVRTPLKWDVMRSYTSSPSFKNTLMWYFSRLPMAHPITLAIGSHWANLGILIHFVHMSIVSWVYKPSNRTGAPLQCQAVLELMIRGVGRDVCSTVTFVDRIHSNTLGQYSLNWVSTFSVILKHI